MELVTVVSEYRTSKQIKAFKIKNGLIPILKVENLIPVYKHLLSRKDLDLNKNIAICQELPVDVACNCTGWDCIACAFSSRNVRTKRDYFNVVKTLKRIYSYHVHKS